MAEEILVKASKLLEFNTPVIDVSLLDAVINLMYCGTGEIQRKAQEILTMLKENNEAWTRVDAVLEYSRSLQSKYFALQILENLVNTRWRRLPRDQCDGIKKYLVDRIISISSNPSLSEDEKVFLNKMNMVLVQIVKREWPKHWPTFISDIVGSSRSNESLCRNNMVILKLLSEEVFDFSSGQMTQTKANHMKQQFCSEFRAIFELCQHILESSTNVMLVEATLNTLLGFLVWIPVGYIFETNLIESLTAKFLSILPFRNVTLMCLTEIAGVTFPKNAPPAYSSTICRLFSRTMQQLNTVRLNVNMLPPHTNIPEAYAMGNDNDQKCISNLALFLSTILRQHCKIIEAECKEKIGELLGTPFDLAMNYLLAISEVDDMEVFKICLDYWNWLVAELYREPPLTNPLLTMNLAIQLIRKDSLCTRYHYVPYLSRLRSVIISRMAKPEEVLVVENDEGEVVRETIMDTDAISLYRTMRETLVYLTHLDCADTERIMTEKLQNQTNGSEWSWKNLNCLCWAIGSISGALMEEDEKRFLVMVIRDLLGLCEQKRGKENKAVIASNIMYVVGQYPRFLRAHWKFLKTVINKLFEFMHETHEGVQDMACDTFIKIANKCRRHFVIIQAGEKEPFIEEILASLNTIICDLSPAQVHVFYEAVGYTISAQPVQIVRDNLIERLMSLPNHTWDDVILKATTNVEILKDIEVVKNLVNILKTNSAACRSIGYPFLPQLCRIYLDMLNVYKVTSENINSAVTLHGESVLKQPLIKCMRAVKTEVLRLINTWISTLSSISESARIPELPSIYMSFVPPLFDTVLFDYQRNVPSAREPEVLSACTVLITQMKEKVSEDVPKILDALFGCTLEMINKDFEDFPEHRINFFQFIRSIIVNCFTALMLIPPAQFTLIVDAIVWAFKHTTRNITEIGLEILDRLLDSFSTKVSPDMAQSFYQQYYLTILSHLLSVVTDSTMAQVAGLTVFAVTLGRMFRELEEGLIKVPLQGPGQVKSNVEYVLEYTFELLKKAFPHLTDEQVRIIVQGILSYDNDVEKLKEHLRDFLVQIKEYTGEDTSDLYLAEKEQEVKAAMEAKRRAAEAVPGILNPHEISEEMIEEPMGNGPALNA
ncbi:Exportin-1 [Trichinella nelsoni]|uniref:Exportin-1 n=1 Tax=Trichinella nelsoni TaxID=6336 RepID=A0A0V0S4V4_9BILA|nr:Exportin-1 [Trichinella nelsoni]